MRDPRYEKLADLLVNYSIALKPGQKVFLRGSSIAEPLFKEVYAKILQAGGFPYGNFSLPGMDEIFYQYANPEQIAHIPPPMELLFTTYDAMITVIADTNTRALTNVDPAKLSARSKANRPIFDAMLNRAAKEEFNWALTLFPTEAHAMDAEMSLAEFEDFFFQACLPDENDPIGYWRRFSARQQHYIDWLVNKDVIHITAPGTDLTMRVGGRKFINCDCKVNIPDGEIFTGPVEDSVEGMVYFTFPAIMGGREVSGVRLWFEKGKVVKATAEKNEDYLLKTLDTDEGARYVGEFAIGTNEGIRKFTREILFDEKTGGSFHMALGAGYPETGSKNESAIHWDMICDLRSGGTITADGEVLYKDGQFVVPAE